MIVDGGAASSQLMTNWRWFRLDHAVRRRVRCRPRNSAAI
jgi:hypothetical protein